MISRHHLRLIYHEIVNGVGQTERRELVTSEITTADTREHSLKYIRRHWPATTGRWPAATEPLSQLEASRHIPGHTIIVTSRATSRHRQP